MDTTKKYIEMCEKAEEIQVLAPRMATRIHTKNNIFICSDYDHQSGGFFYCIDRFSDEDPAVLESSYSTWLPRQDQLQEILNIPIWDIVWEFEKFTEEMTEPDCFKDKSMEQLWLTFVMKEKYNKTWDGKEWIK